MKKTITALALLVSAGLYAQTTIRLEHMDNNSAVIAPNGTIYVTTEPDALTSAHIDLQNTGTVSQSYTVKRYDLILNSDGTNSAAALFCFGGACETPGVMVSENPITLGPNQKSSQLPGDWQMLYADINEISTVGLSHVKYTVINVNNASDSVQFHVRYNDVAATVASHLATKASLYLVPNPAKDHARAVISLPAAGRCAVRIYNVLGAEVGAVDVTAQAGVNNVPLEVSDLKKGIYFVSVRAGGSSVMQRLVID